MVTVLAIMPWAAALIALLFFLFKSKPEFEDDDYLDNIGTVRVAVYKDKAYWVYENIFYQSEITWEPDFTTAQPIDTMSLSQKEVVDLMQVLDELKEQEQG